MWTLDKIIPILPVSDQDSFFALLFQMALTQDSLWTGRIILNGIFHVKKEKKKMYLVIKETARKKVINLEEAIFRLPSNKIKQPIRDQVFYKCYSTQ